MTAPSSTLPPALAWADAHVDIDRISLTDVLGAFAAGHRAALDAPIVTDTRSSWRDQALADYREIVASPWTSAELKAQARLQIYQLEHEAPLLEWEAQA